MAKAIGVYPWWNRPWSHRPAHDDALATVYEGRWVYRIETLGVGQRHWDGTTSAKLSRRPYPAKPWQADRWETVAQLERVAVAVADERIRYWQENLHAMEVLGVL